METKARDPKILILATFSGGYVGANTTGQAHAESRKALLSAVARRPKADEANSLIVKEPKWQ